MNPSRIANTAFDTDFLMRSALDRIRQLEAEVKRLQQQSPAAEKFVWIYQSQKLVKIPLMDVLYIRSESNYSRIFLKSGLQYYMSKTLKTWANEISDSDFLRCHRSFLVNKNEIIEIKRNVNQIVLRNGEIIPTSRRHQKNDVNALVIHDRTIEKLSSSKPQCSIHRLSPKSPSYGN
ncbi:MAG TPA: LytTR family DNA-binding domain-containing protein [Saprospiraceae bacterium]|nr:LytTR family DNA-binding domain-containing protein [Saprospiraceae bacterium]